MLGGCRERRRTALGDATLLDELAGSSGSCGTHHVYSASPHPTLVRTPCLVYWQKRLQKFPPSSTMGCISSASTHIKRFSSHIWSATECRLVLTCGVLLLVCVRSCVPASICTEAQAMARCNIQCELHPLMTKAPKTRPPRTNPTISSTQAIMRTPSGAMAKGCAAEIGAEPPPATSMICARPLWPMCTTRRLSDTL